MWIRLVLLLLLIIWIFLTLSKNNLLAKNKTKHRKRKHAIDLIYWKKQWSLDPLNKTKGGIAQFILSTFPWSGHRHSLSEAERVSRERGGERRHCQASAYRLPTLNSLSPQSSTCRSRTVGGRPLERGPFCRPTPLGPPVAPASSGSSCRFPSVIPSSAIFGRKGTAPGSPNYRDTGGDGRNPWGILPAARVAVATRSSRRTLRTPGLQT